MIYTDEIGLLNKVLDHYKRINVDFGSGGYRYPSASVIGFYHMTDEQLRQSHELVKDVTRAFQVLYPAVQSSEDRINEAVIGTNLLEQQKLVMKSALNDQSISPFCYRIDAIWTGNTFKIIEINPDNAGGLEDSFDLRHLYKTNSNKHSDVPIAASRLADTLLALHGPTPGRIVYTDSICQVMASRLARILNKLSVPAIPIHINDLREDWLDYKWIYRHFLYTDFFVHEAGDSLPAPTKEAVEHFLALSLKKSVAIYNPLSDRLLFDKRLLDPQFVSSYLPANLLADLNRWFAASEVIDSVQAIQLKSVLTSSKVVKWARGLGGKGVYLPGMNYSGEDLSNGEWITQDYYAPEKIPVLKNGNWDINMYLVHGLFVVNGEFAGNHLRVSTNPVVNVSSGGGMIPAL